MQLLKDVAKKMLGKFGLEIQKKNKRSSLQGVLTNLQQNGFVPNSVIDVGAAFGSWSRECAQVFADAQYLLIEPLVEYEQALQKTIASIKNAKYRLIGITDANVEKCIYVHPDLVGSSLKTEHEPHNQTSCTERMIHCETLDFVCGKKNLPSPFLIKLDIQGSELEALNGAREILKTTQALILEVSLIECIKGVGGLDKTINFLLSRGFIAYDLFGFNYRPYDQALAQVDMLFVPVSSPLRRVKWYSNEQQRIEMNLKFQNQRAKETI